ENTRKPENARAAQERSRPTNCPASARSPGPEAPLEAALFRVGNFQRRIVHVIRIEHNDTYDLGRIAAAINANVRSRVTCPNQHDWRRNACFPQQCVKVRGNGLKGPWRWPQFAPAITRAIKPASASVL